MDILNLILGLVIPLVLGALGGLPFWLRRHVIAGNIVGSGIIAAAVIVLIWRAYGNIVRAQNECIFDCVRSFESIYAPLLWLVLLGWVAVFLLLIISGVVEDRVKRTSFKRDWM
jgi:hypothetical protein